MFVEDKLTRPSLLWRAISTVTLAFTGTISKIFLIFAARAEAHGLDGFLDILKEREDVSKRRKGLLTGKNRNGLRGKWLTHE
jgi:monolysocardiolipin acyltransferase